MNEFYEAVSIYLRNCAVTPEKENIQYSRKNGKEAEKNLKQIQKEAATTSGKNPRA